jgi:hypothetical protein
METGKDGVVDDGDNNSVYVSLNVNRQKKHSSRVDGTSSPVWNGDEKHEFNIVDCEAQTLSARVKNHHLFKRNVRSAIALVTSFVLCHIYCVLFLVAFVVLRLLLSRHSCCLHSAHELKSHDRSICNTTQYSDVSAWPTCPSIRCSPSRWWSAAATASSAAMDTSPCRCTSTPPNDDGVHDDVGDDEETFIFHADARWGFHCHSIGSATTRHHVAAFRRRLDVDGEVDGVDDDGVDDDVCDDDVGDDEFHVHIQLIGRHV